jgi:hypothetical protein
MHLPFPAACDAPHKTANVLVQHLNNRLCAGKSSKSLMGDMIEGDMIRIDYFKATVCSLLS